MNEREGEETTVDYHEPEGICAYVKKLNEGKQMLHEPVYFKRMIDGIEAEVALSLIHIYKIGTWIRDNTQGIGTMTYVKGTSFGGLGHGIYDMDTGTLLKIKMCIRDRIL